MQPANRLSLACLVGLSLFSFAALAPGQPAKGPEASKPRPHASTRLDPSIITEFDGVKAVTKPSHDAVMGFSVATQVRGISVRGGQDVTKGTLLVTGDDIEDIAVLKLQKAKA